MSRPAVAGGVGLVDDSAPPVLDVVVPVHNEEVDLDWSVRRLHRYLTNAVPYRFRITIVDNASTDSTPFVATALAEDLPHVRAIRLEEKGRGRALRVAWSRSDAEVLAYMDVDLSTDLAALLPLIAPLISGHSDLAIGSRLTRGARVVRGPKRELISRSYNFILRTVLGARFTDAQCGFKAIRREVAVELLPDIEDTGWFFDTELLVAAQRRGLRIYEVPVDWVDDSDSRVDIVSTAIADLKGVARLLRSPGNGQFLKFVSIGILSTIAYALLFLGLRQPLGAQAANFFALALTAIANTAANRRITFGVRGADRAVRQQTQGLLVFIAGLAATAGSLAILHAVSSTPPGWVEVMVLLAATVATTIGRYAAFRLWVFPARNRAEIGVGP